MKRRINYLSIIAIIFLSATLGFSQISAESGTSSASIAIGGSKRTVSISRSGNYRLATDLHLQGSDGLHITASNVSIDLDGHSISSDVPGMGRGIVIDHVQGVKIHNGFVSGFHSNIFVVRSLNVRIEDLQLLGKGLAPNGGPSEIGVQIINSRNVSVARNNISSVNLGVFVRGGGSGGNRIFENVITGGSTDANNLLGICYNPAPNAGPEGPRGDNVFNNHVSRFNYAFSISEESLFNIFNNNTAASFTGLFRDPGATTGKGGTNVSVGNLETILPTGILP